MPEFCADLHQALQACVGDTIPENFCLCEHAEAALLLHQQQRLPRLVLNTSSTPCVGKVNKTTDGALCLKVYQHEVIPGKGDLYLVTFSTLDLTKCTTRSYPDAHFPHAHDPLANHLEKIIGHNMTHTRTRTHTHARVSAITYHEFASWSSEGKHGGRGACPNLLQASNEIVN